MANLPDNPELLGCLRLRFMRFKVGDRENQTVKIEYENNDPFYARDA